MRVCTKCGQTSLTDMTHEWEGKKVCKQCRDILYNAYYNWDNDRLAVELEIGCDFTDYETIVVPFKENVEQLDSFYGEDEHTVIEAFQMLQEKWLEEDWGYHGNMQNLRLVIADVKDPSDTTGCAEFWKFYCYKENMIESDLYDRPFDDEPNGDMFSSNYARMCKIGDVYSKSFRYSCCEHCGRYVCEQNPSNGWHSQGHLYDYGFECNKCYEERTLEHGINDDYDGNTIPGQFYNVSDIEEHGWEMVVDSMMVGSGYSGFRSPEDAHKEIQQLIDDNWLVLINYGSMAIGGLGGYITIYRKPQKVTV